FWPLAVSAAKESKNLGQCLSRARHQWEARCGLNTLEVPLSSACETESFRWFTLYLLSQLPRFVAVYNKALTEYREVHGLRSHSHPVPDLAMEDGWLEAPFWIWT